MLVGRDALLGAGVAALDGAVAGRGRLLLLAGEAGIGKTSLAHALLDDARARGAVVRIGACWETEGLPAFTPWLDALHRPGGDAVADAAALLEGDDTATDAASAQRTRRRRFAAVVDALQAAGETAPQVVLLEDLHWADEPSLELLAAVAAHLPGMPVLIIGTYRPDELGPGGPLAALGGRADRHDLTGISAGAVGELLGALLAEAPTDDEARTVHARSGGNPLFVTQLARLIDAGSTAAPAGVRDVLERRLARVSTDVAEVLGAAAVLGHEFDRTALAAILDIDPARALEAGRAAGLVEPTADPDRWRFVHALVQTTHYDGLPIAQREAWHRRAVDALRSRPGTSAAVLSHHATRAGLDAEPLAAELLIAAGREALARYAWDDAGAAFERARRAAGAGPDGDALRAEAWLGTGDARLRADRADARAAFDAAVDLGRALGRPDVVARAALGFGVGLGAFEVHLLDHRQIELLEEAATVLPDDDPLLPLVLARLSGAVAFVDSDDRRVELATRSVELARAAGDAVVLGNALAAWCDAMSGPAHCDERREAGAEIVALAERAGDAPLELLGRRHRVMALLEAGARHETDLEISAYERTATTLGDPFYAWFVPLWRAMRAFAIGEIDTALELSEEASALGALGGSLNSAVLGPVQRLMFAADLQDAPTAIAELRRMFEIMPISVSEYGDFMHAYLDVRLGPVDEIAPLVRPLAPAMLDGLPFDSEWMASVVQVTVGSVGAGPKELVHAVRTAMTPRADVHAIEGIGTYSQGSGHRFVALAAAFEGDAEAARVHLAAARDAAAGGGRFLEAMTALDAAWAFDLLELETEADDAIAAARRLLTGLGLTDLAERATTPVRRQHAPHTTTAPGPPPTPSPPNAADASPSLVRQGDLWAWTWQGSTAHVRHAKGMADLAVLLERPGREVHVRELEGVADVAGRPASDQAALDETAVAQYRQRIQDLEEDLDEAELHGDTGRAAKLAAERDALVDELTKAFGLGGKARRAGSDPDERLRKAVSARVKASIDRVEEQIPGLGRHLRNSIRTGFWCTYDPEHPTPWTVHR